MKRYLALFAVAIVFAFAVSRLERTFRDASPARSPAEAAIVVTVELSVQDGALAPARTAVDKDRQVRLTVENRGTRPARLTLAGYQDRLDTGAIAPGARWQGAFLADRPGEDFVWLLDSIPSGRFEVRGDHLVEGHR